MVMFNPVERDTISPSSMAGLLGMYSTNKTWFALAFARMYLAEDNWRLTGAGGGGGHPERPAIGWIPPLMVVLRKHRSWGQQQGD